MFFSRRGVWSSRDGYWRNEDGWKRGGKRSRGGIAAQIPILRALYRGGVFILVWGYKCTFYLARTRTFVEQFPLLSLCSPTGLLRHRAKIRSTDSSPASNKLRAPDSDEEAAHVSATSVVVRYAARYEGSQGMRVSLGKSWTLGSLVPFLEYIEHLAYRRFSSFAELGEGSEKAGFINW